jgi:excisionase family DNA binding protein
MKLMPISEAADVLGVTPGTLRRYIREGRLPVVRLHERTLRVRDEDLAALVRRVAPSEDAE